MLENIQKELGLLNPVPRDKFHTTIAYSRVSIPFKTIPAYFAGESSHLEIWDTKSGRTLVLKLKSDQLVERHDYSMILGGTYDFPEYLPHITLSYDLGGQLVHLPTNTIVPIVVSEEYVTILDENWSDKKV